MKLRILSNFSPSLVESGKLFSFLNFYSIDRDISKSESSSIYYFCDGILAAKYISAITKTNVTRVSFDFGSIADEVFRRCIRKKLKLFIIGGTRYDIREFVRKLKVRYPALNIVGYMDGFEDLRQGEGLHRVCSSKANVVIVGTGAGKQEQLLLDMSNNGYKGTGFTCGGFISQTSASTTNSYYPDIVNQYHLRWAYRMLKEPHTIKRYFVIYPRSIFILTIKFIMKITQFRTISLDKKNSV